MKDRCRRLLHQTTPGDLAAGADAAFLLDLLQRHPDAAVKVGAGVAYFTVELNAPYGTPGFWLHRSTVIAGSLVTAEAFSYLKCLRPQSRQHSVTQALAIRKTVDDPTKSHGHLIISRSSCGQPRGDRAKLPLMFTRIVCCACGHVGVTSCQAACRRGPDQHG